MSTPRQFLMNHSVYAPELQTKDWLTKWEANLYKLKKQVKQNLENLSVLFNLLENSVWSALEKQVPTVQHMLGCSLCICLYLTEPPRNQLILFKYFHFSLQLFHYSSTCGRVSYASKNGDCHNFLQHCHLKYWKVPLYHTLQPFSGRQAR